jgi:hypothetical protein
VGKAEQEARRRRRKDETHLRQQKKAEFAEQARTFIFPLLVPVPVGGAVVPVDRRYS